MTLVTRAGSLLSGLDVCNREGLAERISVCWTRGAARVDDATFSSGAVALHARFKDRAKANETNKDQIANFLFSTLLVYIW